MANKKQPYNWNRVKPGDIISFRYKSKSTGKTRVQSLLVLNPRLNVTLKDGNKNNLYKLEIDRKFVINDIKGIKQEAYDKISKSFNIQGQYRTYDYIKAKSSAVYLEPIRVFTDED